MSRPETYSAFEFMAWVLENQDTLLFRTMPGLKVPLSTLRPRELCHWAQRMFYDRAAPVHTEAEWEALDAAKVEIPPSPF